jgi:hypothetical protein
LNIDDDDSDTAVSSQLENEKSPTVEWNMNCSLQDSFGETEYTSAASQHISFTVKQMRRQ